MQLDVIKKYNYDKFLTLLIEIYCILLPFEEALAGPFGSVVKLIGVAIIAYIIISYKKIVVKRYNYILIAWIVFGVISGLWSESYDWWMRYLKIYGSQIAFLIVVTGVNVKRINTEKIRRALVASAGIASTILVFMPQTSEFTEDGRRSIIMFGHRFDPNIVSAIILLGILAALEEIFLLERGYRRKFYILLLILSFIGIFYTGSRGGLISAVIASSVSLFCEAKKKENRKEVRHIIIFATLVAIIIIPMLPASITENRFSPDNILGLNEFNAGVHNRYSIWLSAIKLIPDSPLIGYGLGNFFTAITKVYHMSCASHNLFILLIVETGILGLTMFVIFIANLLKKLKQYQLHTAFGMMVGILIMSLTLDALPYKFFWVALMYVQLLINSKQYIYEKTD